MGQQQQIAAPADTSGSSMVTPLGHSTSFCERKACAMRGRPGHEYVRCARFQFITPKYRDACSARPECTRCNTPKTARPVFGSPGSCGQAIDVCGLCSADDETARVSTVQYCTVRAAVGEVAAGCGHALTNLIQGTVTGSETRQRSHSHQVGSSWHQSTNRKATMGGQASDDDQSEDPELQRVRDPASTKDQTRPAKDPHVLSKQRGCGCFFDAIVSWLRRAPQQPLAASTPPSLSPAAAATAAASLALVSAQPTAQPACELTSSTRADAPLRSGPASDDDAPVVRLSARMPCSSCKHALTSTRCLAGEGHSSRARGARKWRYAHICPSRCTFGTRVLTVAPPPPPPMPTPPHPTPDAEVASLCSPHQTSRRTSALLRCCRRVSISCATLCAAKTSAVPSPCPRKPCARCVACGWTANVC